MRTPTLTTLLDPEMRRHDTRDPNSCPNAEERFQQRATHEMFPSFAVTLAALLGTQAAAQRSPKID